MVVVVGGGVVTLCQMLTCVANMELLAAAHGSSSGALSAHEEDALK